MQFGRLTNARFEHNHEFVSEELAGTQNQRGSLVCRTPISASSIGRFQPLHIGHEHVVRQALSSVKHLIVLVGSANTARDPRNPFTFEERKAMFRASFAYEMAEERLIIEPLNDHLYSDTAWVTEVQRRVNAIVGDIGNGHGHDEASPPAISASRSPVMARMRPAITSRCFRNGAKHPDRQPVWHLQLQ